MDGYRQSLLGRALADALQDLEKEQYENGADISGNTGKLDGDLLFTYFDQAMQLELSDNGQENLTQTFTHDLLKLTGRVTAFNRFENDWSLLAQVRSQDIHLDHSLLNLHLPHEHHEQELSMRLKLRKIPR
ncbi:uncharacterized protein PHALS_01301 [Plasmopara halstedii]|uniref:Uncharacterized protein n=1 Tax=Plasmopara halstedii TaxID=4781 RepID=A0A0P1AUY2_PLAHL|nr:uncharacterized protein PHALS_01301 [Plasmopara halstedii]CEG44978.1 hypothetical protein PHALS_01301 [Plasmopara halstedii]|eukprot:XP_024581347.1 hypothetical protein PHALS_01301 [Plasmopara halstedii]